jgi:hypothetical protein
VPVDSKHPDYEDRVEEWQQMRDCVRGETAVKARSQRLLRQPYAVAKTQDVTGTGPYDVAPDEVPRQAVVVVGTTARFQYVSEYLPIPDGFRYQADDGYYLYRMYITRAQFPEILAPTITGMVGLIHRKESVIKLPKALEPLYERATCDGLSLEALHKRVTRELLIAGRYSLLPDFDDSSDVPYLAGYVTESLINWSPECDMFVLDESTKTQDSGDEFTWVDKVRHRVLRLRGRVYTQQVYNGDRPEPAITPTVRGGKPLDFIPLVTFTSVDLSVTPETPPLIGVARSSLAMFRLDADYRHQLYNTGQETLIISGAEGKPDAIGAGVVLNLPLGATAAYVGPKGVGIASHRLAISDERENAVVAGAKMFDSMKEGVEAAEALKIRFAAQGATLVSVAIAAAQGLERSLRNCATMVGANPDEVLVTPNLDFVDAALTPKQAVELVKMWQADAISFETLQENLQRGGIASIERTIEDERGLIETGNAPTMSATRDGIVPKEPASLPTGLPTPSPSRTVQ